MYWQARPYHRQAWLDADCDGDGVTNGDEVADGTDPLDNCDLVWTIKRYHRARRGSMVTVTAMV
ncbi:MAG: thrombospondin type 3 repeat-containing protein [Flavobacteriaceae bacterium]